MTDREKWEQFVEEAKLTATESRLAAILYAARRMEKLEKVREKAISISKIRQCTYGDDENVKDCRCSMCILRAALAAKEEE